MVFAKQSTAIIVTVGPVLSATGVAVTDGVVGDFKISKNGGVPAALDASATLTHRATGHYSLSLTATDVNTVGTVEVIIDDTVNACPIKEIQVVETVIYDALFADGANAFTGAAGASKITGVVLTDTLTTYTGNTVQTGDSFARIGAAGAGLTDLGGMSTTMKAQVESEVDDALGGGTGTALTAIPWNASWDAEVQSEVDDAIVVHRLDELLNADSDIDGAAPPTVGSVFHELMTKTAGSFTYDQTTDSLEALRDRGDAAWITATGFSTHSAADVWAAATRTLTAGTNIQLPSNGLANVTAWTVAITGNITGNLSGSVGSVTGAVGSVTGFTAANVATIMAKTDSLTFTVAGQVDANIQSVNDVTVVGNGSGTPFNV